MVQPGRLGYVGPRSTSRWIMAVADSQSHPKNRIRFYGSTDIKSWKFLSEFGEEVGDKKFHSGKWECPDLLHFEKHDLYVLIVSVNPGGPNGGSGTQYFIGKWNGDAFK